jgi:hypothetical protein
MPSGIAVVDRLTNAPPMLLDDGSDGPACLLKGRPGDSGALAEAVESVMGGGSNVDPKVIDALIEGRIQAKQSTLDRLTARERESRYFRPPRW